VDDSTSDDDGDGDDGDDNDNGDEVLQVYLASIQVKYNYLILVL
jgi:hypothetical protein